MNINDKMQCKKIYRGQMNFFHKNRIYAEENFDVYKDTKVMDMAFISTLHSRTTTGELMQIKTYYEINKNWTPNKVIVEKKMGEKFSIESYAFNSQTSSIHYSFSNSSISTEHVMNTNPKFHITTPTAASSMLFIQTKKFDATSSNECVVVVSENQWFYEKPPKTSNLYLEKLSLTSEPLTLNKSVVQNVRYRIYNTHLLGSADPRKKDEIGEDVLEPVFVYLSQHVSIPYILENEDNKIMIKFLRDLDND